MERISKRLGLLVALLFVLSAVFTGCTTPAPAATTPPATTSTVAPATVAPATETPAVTSTPEPLKPVELIWYQYIGKKNADEQKVMDAVNQYLQGKINATVKQTFMTYDDYNTKMPVIISSGQPFDICFTTSWMLSYTQYVAKGAFMPMDELLANYGKETKAAFPEALWKGVTVNGKIYGVPGYKETGHQYGIIYNADIATKLGLDMSTVKKWTDLAPILQKVKDGAPDVMPLSNGADDLYKGAFPQEHITSDWNLPGVLNVPGIEAYQRNNNKIFNQYDTPEFMQYCTTIHDWWTKGYLPKDPNQYASQAGTDDTAGKLFSWLIWYAPGCEGDLEAQKGHKVGYIPLFNPILETADCNGGSIEAISANSSNSERAMMFLNLLNTDITLGTMIRHGIEGIHYKVVDGQCDMTATGNDPKNLPYDSANGWWFGTIFNQMWTTSYPKNIAQLYLDYNKTAKPTTGLGFVFDPQPVANETAAFANVYKQYGIPVIDGVADPATYVSQFVSQMKANGSDKVIAEAQKQLDAWSKK